jgi:hypothetical protein
MGPSLAFFLRGGTVRETLTNPLMPAIAKERQQYHLSKVRSLIAENHQITFEEIVEQLDRRFGLKFDRDYVTKLAKKIFVERTKRADRLTLNYALAAFDDSMNEVVKKAWEIANADYVNPQARVMALREIREAHSAVFEKLFDAGVFERKLGTLDATIRNTPLPEERKQAIRVAFENWGLLEAPKEDVPPANTPTA